MTYKLICGCTDEKSCPEHPTFAELNPSGTSLTKECFDAGTDWMPPGWTIEKEVPEAFRMQVAHQLTPGVATIHLDNPAASFRDDDK